MGVLTIIFLLMIILAVRSRLKFSAKSISLDDARRNMTYVRSLGILAFVVGVFGQLLGLYQAFDAIQEAGDVSPGLLMGGLKISMITSLYGAFILICGLVLSLILDSGMRKNAED